MRPADGMYRGSVRHRRFEPRGHSFRYGLTMALVDVDWPERSLPGRWIWSAGRRGVAQFRREDHGGDCAVALGETVRRWVAEETGVRPAGPIYLLTQLRYWGFYMNPVCFYFCLDAQTLEVAYVVLEVQNTPWNERHVYVTRARPNRDVSFTKRFHVSPFMEMDMSYRLQWRLGKERIAVHLENWYDGRRVFDATMTMKKMPHSVLSRLRAIASYPFMTAQILAAIYFEAFRLWWKRTPYVPHPKHDVASAREVPFHE